MPSKIDWIISFDGSIHPFGHKCLRCGAEENLPTPIPLHAFIAWAESFIKIHKHCKEKNNAQT